MPQRFAGGGISTTDAKSAGEEPRLRDASAEEPEEAMWQMQHLQLIQARLKARRGPARATGVAFAGKDRHWTSELAQRLHSGQTSASDSPAAAYADPPYRGTSVKRVRQIH